MREWLYHDLFCALVVECKPLSKPNNGHLSVNGLSTGSVANITCDEGFDLRGSSSRTCQLNKEWSGNATICQGKAIRAVSIIDNVPRRNDAN